MMTVWITVLFLTGMISTSSSWPDFDLPDDLPDRIPDHLPDHLPEFGTLPPDLFKNISISVACDAALARMFSDKRSYEATLALDACGKPEPGFLVGNLAWLGHWPECKSLEDFHFCTTFLRLNMSTGVINPLMRWGLCLPSECGETDVANSMTEIINRLEYDELNTLNPRVTRVQCATFPSRPYDAGFYCTVILCCVAALLMISGALFEVHLDRQKKKKREEALEDSEALLLLRHGSKQNGYGASKTSGEQQKKDHKGCCERFLLCFSFTRNLRQILKTDTKDGSMLCLNGIRVISMTWVILGHTIMLIYQVFGATWDGIFALDTMKSFPVQAIINAFPSVDSFFLLSGLLLTYITLGRMSRSDGRIPWAMFYFHRYWRLLPGLGAAMLFTLYLRPYMGEGPLWANTARYSFNCDKYWWTNLLYINNFYPKTGTEGCIYWVWYLANDMQFYIISPIFLVSLFRKPVVGMIIIAVLCIASFATTIGLMVVNDFKVALMGFGESTNGKDIFSVVYIKPYCRITPYLVGIVLGYAFHSWRGRRIRINKIAVIVGWASAIATGLAVVYGLYGEFNGSPLSTAENAIYMAFAHFAWAIALSWVIFACHYGYGGWINDFLSWKAWIPLCRLTYGAYLFHPLLMHIFVGNTAHAYSLNAVYIAYYFTSCCVFSFLVSLLVSLGFELPLANLEGFIM